MPVRIVYADRRNWPEHPLSHARKPMNRILVTLALVISTAAAAGREQEVKPVAPITPIQVKNPFADVPASHQQTAVVTVNSTDGKQKLQTISLDADGRVLALTAPPKTFGAPV